MTYVMYMGQFVTHYVMMRTILPEETKEGSI